MSGTATTSLPSCRPLLADPDDLSLVFQPIVDLAGARIVGYEALSRFPGTAGPEVWFTAAAECGVAAELAALALAKALDTVPLLPGGTFLSVQVGADLLDSRPVAQVLAGRAALDGVVVSLTGHPRAGTGTALRRRADALRARGARIALDDAGAGCSGLQSMAAVAPELVRLDRALVSGVDVDPVRATVVEMAGDAAGRIGARLVAEGVETSAELAALAGLGVPLVQGWLLGRPLPEFAPLAPEAARLLRAQAVRTEQRGLVAGLLRPVRSCEAGAEPPGVPPAVLLDGAGRPLTLLLADPRTGQPYRAPVSLQVPPSADAAGTLRRALERPPGSRFDPVLCTAEDGAVLGLLRIEDLAAAGRRTR